MERLLNHSIKNKTHWGYGAKLINLAEGSNPIMMNYEIVSKVCRTINRISQAHELDTIYTLNDAWDDLQSDRDFIINYLCDLINEFIK